MDSFYTSSIAVCGAMVACRGSPASQLGLRAALARMTQSTARLFHCPNTARLCLASATLPTQLQLSLHSDSTPNSTFPQKLKENKI